MMKSVWNTAQIQPNNKEQTQLLGPRWLMQMLNSIKNTYQTMSLKKEI